MQPGQQPTHCMTESDCRHSIIIHPLPVFFFATSLFLYLSFLVCFSAADEGSEDLLSGDVHRHDNRFVHASRDVLPPADAMYLANTQIMSKLNSFISLIIFFKGLILHNYISRH